VLERRGVHDCYKAGLNRNEVVIYIYSNDFIIANEIAAEISEFHVSMT
jgi:hypothetical protein